MTNFNQRVENYVKDNLHYIAEYNDAPTAQDILDHWDTNGPEGIGEALTNEQRTEFIGTATRVLKEELKEAAWRMLEAHMTYEVSSVAFTEETEDELLRSKTFTELLAVVGKSEQEIRDEFKRNGTLL